MNWVTDADVLDAAAGFRAALDAIDPAIRSSDTIDRFPHGACGDAAELLGRYLRETLSIECAYILKDGHDADGSWRGGHAWFDHDGLIIGITGAQFGRAPVIVTRHSPAHDAADDHLRQPLTNNMCWWGIYGAPIYAEALRIIVAAQAAPRGS